MTKISQIINGLPKQDKQFLDSLITVKAYNKGEIVFNQKSLDTNIYYIESGLLRKYLIKNEKEKTLDFYFPDDIYFPNILIENKKTNCFLQALEKSTVYILNNFQFEEIKSTNLSILSLENKILESAFLQANERLIQFQTMNATERYLHLLDKNPEIVMRINLTHIASFLGINNASLSKIRSGIR